MVLIPLLHLHSMSSVTFCFDMLDTFCDVSAFLVVIGSQPGGMDVKIPELRKETAGTRVFALNFSLVRSCQSRWFEHDSEFIQFHHPFFLQFIL